MLEIKIKLLHILINIRAKFTRIHDLFVIYPITRLIIKIVTKVKMQNMMCFISYL